MSTQTNPYFKSRDRSLRKARKHYERAVEMHFMGIWLDEVNAMADKMHEDTVAMYKRYKEIEHTQKQQLRVIKKRLREIEESVGYW